MGSILTKARNLAADGVLSARDVGKLLSEALTDGEVSRAERSDLNKLTDEFDADLSPAARKAVREFLQLGDTFDGNLASRLFGVSEADADKLEKAGVRSTTELLASTRTHDDRLRVAGAAGVDVVVVTSLAEQADLSRTLGVGRTYARVLEQIGINNVAELSEQNPVSLRRMITNFLKTSGGAEITNRRPSEKTVKKWVDNAKTLPKLIRALGDDGPAFDRAAFDALPNEHKAMLFWGQDVYLDDGSVFPKSDLSVSTPQRKPRKVSDMIALLEGTGFNATYDFAQLARIERIKLEDDTLGFRAVFDIRTVETMDSEGYGYDQGMEGFVDVALDNDGNILAQEVDLWPGDYEV